MKFKFNPRLVPICIYYFLINFSFNMLFPYFTIQMRSLGLSLDDAALISELEQVTRPGGHLVIGQVVIKVRGAPYHGVCKIEQKRQ